MTSTITETQAMLAVPGRPQPGRDGPQAGRRVVAYLFLGVLVVYFLIPIWWLFVASTKDVSGLFDGRPGRSGSTRTSPSSPTSATSSPTTAASTCSGSATRCSTRSPAASARRVLAVLAGYGFAKFRFRGRNLAFALLLGSVMVPLTALVIPTFVLFSDLGLTDTIWAVILPSLLNPFGVYLMQVYATDAVPDELLDAARVDGAGEFRTFFQVAFPLLRPAFVTVLLLSVVGTWNNYFLPLAMLSNTRLFPITVGLGLWEGQASANNGGGHSLWSLIIVGSLVSVIPLVIAFLTLQKYWQGGLSIGSLK